MRPVLAVLSQFAVMAAIVTTLVYVPLGALTGLGLSMEPLLTFGGAVHAAVGIVAGWLISFAAACGYAVWMFPWNEKALAWPERRSP
jgi:hypothetical protein